MSGSFFAHALAGLYDWGTESRMKDELRKLRSALAAELEAECPDGPYIALLRMRIAWLEMPNEDEP